MTCVHQIPSGACLASLVGSPGSNELPLLSDFVDNFRDVRARNRDPAVGMEDRPAQATGKLVFVNHAVASAALGGSHDSR